VEPRTAVAGSASTERAAAVEVVAIDDRSAVRNVGVVVVDCCPAMPVVSPVVPAPSISTKKANSEADSKSNPHSAQEDPRHGVPTRVCNDRIAVHEPRIVRGHIDHVMIGWFDRSPDYHEVQ